MGFRIDEITDELTGAGQTVVWVAIDGRTAGLITVADAVRPTTAAAVAALTATGVETVMVTGDNQAAARRITDQLGITAAVADVLPGDKATKVAELQAGGTKVAMVGDGVNDAPAGPSRPRRRHRGGHRRGHRNRRRGPHALRPPRRRRRPDHRPGHAGQDAPNLGWAIGYNSLAVPITAGVFEPAFGLVLRPEISALAMSGFSVIVAVNALLLRRLRLPASQAAGTTDDRGAPQHIAATAAPAT
jgi:P-type Cu2+ transporter